MEIPEEIKDKIQTDENGNETIRVNVPFNKIELFDNESEGTFTGNISFILYKGDHYHLTIDTDWGEALCRYTGCMGFRRSCGYHHSSGEYFV